MNTPRFTANASLYRTALEYHGGLLGVGTSSVVVPQVSWSCVWNCLGSCWNSGWLGGWWHRAELAGCALSLGFSIAAAPELTLPELEGFGECVVGTCDRSVFDCVMNCGDSPSPSPSPPAPDSCCPRGWRCACGGRCVTGQGCVGGQCLGPGQQCD